MSSMVVSQLENIETFLNKDTELTSYGYWLSQLPQIKDLEPSEKLKADLEKLKSKDRLLNVGIIGRVKAGKSSLLNSLLFDGEDILPKAATPMTAALTIMEYSDTVKAEIDFFTPEDIAQLAKESNAYLTELERVKQEKLAELQNHPRAKSMSSSELVQHAEKQAKTALEKHHCLGSYDQYQRIQQQNIPYAELEQLKEQKGSSVDELMGKLKDFVGSSGRYMPLTKAVKIYLPNAGLKDLQVIDTPGVNDPVKSREERTEKFLSECDVVFIVSLTGDFLSDEDVNLMSRITESKGIKQIYVIASQADNDLYGSEKQATVTQALDILSQKHTTTLRQLSQSENGKKLNKDVVARFQQNPVICNASIAYIWLKHFDRIETMSDENVKWAWNNLITHYPYLRNNPEQCKAELAKLACMDKFEQIFTEIKTEKEQILMARVADLENAQKDTALGVVKAINKHIDDKIKEIENADIHSLRKQSEQLANSATALRKEMGEKYEGLITDYQRTLKGALRQELDYQLNGFDPDSARDTKTENRTRTEYYEVRVEGSVGRKVASFFTFGLVDDHTYETRSREVSYSVSTKVVYANQIRSSIKSILDELETALNGKYHSARKKFTNSLEQEMKVFFKAFCKTHSLDLEEKTLTDAISRVIKGIPNEEFELDKNLPSEIDKTGVLSESEGNSFIRAAERYVSRLEEDKEDEIDEKVQDIYRTLIGFDLSKKLVESINKDVKDLIEFVENKEHSLMIFNRLKEDAKAL